jgi:hypothetical protein
VGWCRQSGETKDNIMSDEPVSGGPVTAEFIADLAAASRNLDEQDVVDEFSNN